MEKADREFLLMYLAASRERLLDTVNGLNKEQARFRPSRDRWSVADCVEHVAIVEKEVLNKIQAILLAPPQAEPSATTSDDAILSGVPNRSARCSAPVDALPRRRWTDLRALLRQFEAARERSLRFAAVTQSDLRAYFFLHPEWGELDCYQWLLFLGAHSERHARQADDVAADPAFPRVADSAAV